METKPVAFPGGIAHSKEAQSWPPAGFPPTSRGIPPDNRDTNCLPRNPISHMSKSLALRATISGSFRKYVNGVPSLWDIPGSVETCRLHVRSTSHPTKTRIHMSGYGSGMGVFKTCWWIMTDLLVETHKIH